MFTGSSWGENCAHDARVDIAYTKCWVQRPNASFLKEGKLTFTLYLHEAGKIQAWERKVLMHTEITGGNNWR